MTDPGLSTGHLRSKKIGSIPAEAQSPKDIEPSEAPVVATGQDDDERMLATIGYRQVLTAPRSEDS